LGASLGDPVVSSELESIMYACARRWVFMQRLGGMDLDDLAMEAATNFCGAPVVAEDS
jgi:hypothetical protein